nr:hypothetical protein [Tanacetum cinerariifolium]
GSKSRPPMLNKENYVPWSSRLLRYAKSRPNGKLIHNFLINGPYVRRMIPEPGDTYAAVQIEADDQAIQTILLGLLEDIYAVEKKAKLFNEWERHQDPTTVLNVALALMAKAFKLNYSTPTNNNQRILSNPRNRQIAQPGMNMGQDRQIQMVGGNGENQFREYAGQNVGNLNGYNAVHNVGNQVAQNPRAQNVGNQNRLIGVPGNANQNGNGNLRAARAEGNTAGHNGIQLQAKVFDLMATAADLDEIEEVNANCILMANL